MENATHQMEQHTVLPAGVPMFGSLLLHSLTFSSAVLRETVIFFPS